MTDAAPALAAAAMDVIVTWQLLGLRCTVRGPNPAPHGTPSTTSAETTTIGLVDLSPTPSSFLLRHRQEFDGLAAQVGEEFAHCTIDLHCGFETHGARGDARRDAQVVAVRDLAVVPHPGGREVAARGLVDRGRVHEVARACLTQPLRVERGRAELAGARALSSRCAAPSLRLNGRRYVPRRLSKRPWKSGAMSHGARDPRMVQRWLSSSTTAQRRAIHSSAGAGVR